MSSRGGCTREFVVGKIFLKFSYRIGWILIALHTYSSGAWTVEKGR